MQSKIQRGTCSTCGKGNQQVVTYRPRSQQDTSKPKPQPVDPQLAKVYQPGASPKFQMPKAKTSVSTE